MSLCALNRHFRDPPPLPPLAWQAWQGQTMCVDLRSDDGVDHMPWSRLFSPPTFIHLNSGASFIWTALAKTAMASPSLCSAINSSVPSTVHVVLLLSLLSRFLCPPCLFHVLFYSKQLATMTDRQRWPVYCLDCGLEKEGRLWQKETRVTRGWRSKGGCERCSGSPLSLHFPRALLFKAPNTDDWLLWLTGSAGTSVVCSQEKEGRLWQKETERSKGGCERCSGSQQKLQTYSVPSRHYRLRRSLQLMPATNAYIASDDFRGDVLGLLTPTCIQRVVCWQAWSSQQGNSLTRCLHSGAMGTALALWPQVNTDMVKNSIGWTCDGDREIRRVPPSDEEGPKSLYVTRQKATLCTQ